MARRKIDLTLVELDAPKQTGTSDFVGAGIAGAADSVAFGFNDELSAGIKAPWAYLGSQIAGTDKSLGKAYDEQLAKNRADKKAIEQRNPVGYGTGEVIGAIGGGLLGAGTKAATATARGISRGLLPSATSGLGKAANIATKAGVASAAGAASAGLAGLGAGEGVEGRLQNAADSASTGAVLGPVLAGAGNVAGKVIKGIGSEAQSLIPANPKTAEELRKAAGPLYNKFTQSGGVYSDRLTNEIADLADAQKLTGIAGVMDEADQVLNKRLDYYSSLRGKTLSPDDLQKLDQKLASDVGRFNQAGERNFGRILNDLKYEMRNRAFDPSNAANYISQGSAGSVEALKEANRLYSQSYKAADIEKILAKAKGTENPQTSIRTNLKNLLANEKKMANYSKEERAVLEEALKRGTLGGAIKLFGGRLTDSVAGGIAGMSAGGPAGAVAGSVAGKAVGGLAADAAGAIQANKLRGALGKIQTGNTQASATNLPAVLQQQNVIPATIGLESLSRSEPSAPLSPPTGRRKIDLNEIQLDATSPEMIPQGGTQTIMQPMSQDTTLPASNEVLSRIKQAESGGNPNAKNPNSTASGLYQFTDSTWNSVVDKYGARYGITRQDKANPQAQEIMAQRLTEENAAALSKRNIEPNTANLYLAHFLGPAAAVKALQSLGKNASAAQLFPKAAQANQSIFFNKGKPRTIDEVYAVIAKKVGQDVA